MRHDYPRAYRNAPFGSASDALSITPRLGHIWWASTSNLLPPEPTRLDRPWFQVVRLGEQDLDPVQDRLIVADAELTRHGLAWRLEAETHRGNVFVDTVDRLALHTGLNAAVPPRDRVALGLRLHGPLTAEPRVEVRAVQVNGVELWPADRRALLARLGLPDSG